jgi:hypothetical protein
MRQAAPLSKQSQKHPVNPDDSVPHAVFYFVQTSSGAVGKRHHGVSPPLYETPHQAQVELMHLQTASSGRGTSSIWKATPYVEPAEWLYDVVVANGSMIRLRDREPRRAANREREKRPCSESAVGRARRLPKWRSPP